MVRLTLVTMTEPSWPVRDDSEEFDLIVRPFAEAIHAKAAALRSLALTPQQRARFRESMTQDLRKCSDVLLPTLRPPLVSQAARILADGLGVDLQVQTWHTQKRFDKDRAVFHFEHVFPLGQLTNRCNDAESIGGVVELLRRHLRVAWITKDEDQVLTALGYKSVRPDPTAAYKAAGIHLTG